MIKAGDLVVVTRPTPCCGNATHLGRIFTVSEIGLFLSQCVYCGNSRIQKMASVNKFGGEPLSTLTRIDPLPESETHRDEVAA